MGVEKEKKTQTKSKQLFLQFRDVDQDDNTAIYQVLCCKHGWDGSSAGDGVGDRLTLILGL